MVRTKLPDSKVMPFCPLLLDKYKRLNAVGNKIQTDIDFFPFKSGFMVLFLPFFKIQQNYYQCKESFDKWKSTAIFSVFIWKCKCNK